MPSRRSFIRSAAGLFVAAAVPLVPERRYWQLDRTHTMPMRWQPIYSYDSNEPIFAGNVNIEWGGGGQFGRLVLLPGERQYVAAIDTVFALSHDGRFSGHSHGPRRVGAAGAQTLLS